MLNNQLVQALKNLLLTPTSDFYISNLLHDPDKQSLDPLVIERIDMGSFDILESKIEVVYADIVLKGLSNTQVRFDANNKPEIIVDGSRVSFKAKHPNTQAGYDRPTDVPAEIVGSGRLIIRIDGNLMPEGTLALTIKSVNDVQGVFNATLEVEEQLDTAQVEFTAISFNPEVTNENLAIDIELESIFVSVIKQILNREDKLQTFVNELNIHLSTDASLAGLSQVATQYARLALGDLRAVANVASARINHNPNAHFALTIPYTFINLKITQYVELLIDELWGVYEDDELGMTITWMLSSAPTIVPGYIDTLKFTMVIFVQHNGLLPPYIQASYSARIDFVKEEDQFALQLGEDSAIVLTPHDPFVDAILKRNKANFQQYIQKYLNLFNIRIVPPPFLPEIANVDLVKWPTPPNIPTEQILRINFFPTVTDLPADNTEQSPVALAQSNLNENTFIAHITQSKIKDYLDKEFWNPLEKSFSQQGATIKLDHFSMESGGDIVALLITMSGRVRADIPVLPDPEWWIEFKRPLDIHLQLYVVAENSVKIKYSETYFPDFELHGYNGAADLYGHLIPVLEDLVHFEVFKGIATHVQSLVLNIDEHLYTLPQFEYRPVNKEVTIKPFIKSIDSVIYSSIRYVNFYGDFDMTVEAD